MGLGRDGESVIHVRHLVTIGCMSRERGWAKDTDLGFISTESFQSLGLDQITWELNEHS